MRNIRKSNDINDPITRVELNPTYDIMNSMFDKKATPLNKKTISTSSQNDIHRDCGRLSDLIEINKNSQRIINKTFVDGYIFVLLKLDQAIQSTKLSFISDQINRNLLTQ